VLKIYNGSAWQAAAIDSSGFVETTGDSMTGNLSFGDNDKAIFGAGSDLQIFHLSANNASYIQEQNASASLNIDGTDVYIRSYPEGDNMIIAERDGAVTLHYDNASKLATTSTGVDITGTLTSDGLTVAGGITTTVPSVTLDVVEESSNEDVILGLSAEGSARSQIRCTHSLGGASDLRLITDVGASARDRLKIDSNGDISFYEDTGTTPKFFWDASAESLGIGTTSPAFVGGGNPELTISGTVSYFNLQGNRTAGAGNTTGQITNYNGSTAISRIATVLDSGTTDGAMLFSTASSGSIAERMRIDSSGNVGIGTSSPTAGLHIDNPGNGAITAILDTDNTAVKLVFRNNTETGNNVQIGADGSSLVALTNASERMRIDSSGNVGIGLTPSSWFANSVVLQLNTGVSLEGRTNDGSSMSLGGNYYLDGSAAYKYLTTNSAQRYTQAAGTHIWYNAGSGTAGNSISWSERMRIDSSGNLLVGMTSSGYLTADDGIQIKPDGNIRIGGSGTAARNVMSFVNNTGGTPAEVGTITTSGSSTSYNTSSDHRLKENVVDFSGATTRLKQLKPKRFNFVVDADTTVDGFLAHEVQSVVPEAIRGTHNEVDADGNPVYQGIDQSKLVPLLTAALQEALTKIDALETRITALEG